MTLPNYAVGPSEYIEEWLEEADMSQAELARRLGVSGKHVSKLLNGTPLTIESARKLEYVTGIPLKFWMEAETVYRADVQRLKEAEELAKQDIPISNNVIGELRRRGYVSATQRPGEKGLLCQQLMRLFGAGTWAALLSQLQPDNSTGIAYRQSTSSDPTAVAVWLRVGLLEFEMLEPVGAYNQETLETLIPEIRALTTSPPEHFGARLVQILKQAGVYLLYVQDFPRTGTYGATRWVGGNPVIQLSLRDKGDDIFWFTLFHEIGHVLLHGHDAVFVNVVGQEKSIQEQQADNFAMNTLIPPTYADMLGPRISLAEVDRIAEGAGVAPGIVVGRCHYEEYLHPSVGRQKIRSLKVSTADDGVGG